MALTTEEKQALLDQLETDIATGLSGVSSEGENVSFQPLGSMMKARDRLKAEIAAESNTTQPSAVTLAKFSRD